MGMTILPIRDYDVKQQKIRLKEIPKAIQLAFNGRKKYLELTQ